MTKGQPAPPLSWESPVSRLAGLGPSASGALAEVGVRTVGDLLWILPAGYDDLRSPDTVDEAARKAQETGEARVVFRGIVDAASVIPMRGKRALRVVVRGDKVKVHAWWFFLAHGILKLAKPGTEVVISGKLRAEGSRPPRLAHPDLFSGDMPLIRVRYPRFGVPGATLRKAIEAAMKDLEELPDPVPHEIAVREGMPEVKAVLTSMHAPTEIPSIDAMLRMRERVAWAEVFTQAFDRLRTERADAAGKDAARGYALPNTVDIAKLESALGFHLTPSQERAVSAMRGDLALAKPTRRLLLGDVGTGKTAVALAAVADTLASGAQAALLAPTTVLAEQYREAIAVLEKAFGAHVALLTGGTPAAERKRILAGLAEGSIDAAIGTHALLSAGVKFAKLGLVVVDEQHRLGVAQRLALVQKGARPHLLTLSATPIPRTLALAMRGDLPMTTLDERPQGREPVVTELVPNEQADSVVERIRAVVAKGQQVFVICPLVQPAEDDDDDDDSEEASSASAVERAAELREALGNDVVTLVHGAMGHVPKIEAMRAFRRGEARVLVGTTVVEVGVDVPNATLMIVESAERFGLAQLHQLRGRVGRGSVRGTCILMHDSSIVGPARERLDALVRLDNGDEIARADLELRGAGDLWGTRQSGEESGLMYLLPSESPVWLTRIERDAARILDNDPGLEHPEHRALRLAVARFRKALAVREEAG